MPSFGNRVDGLRGRRAFPRQSVVLAASALSITHSRSVVVADITPEGARLHGRHLPSTSSEVLMVVGSQDCFGKVVWNESDGCGVKFDRPFRADQLEQLKLEGQWATVTGCAG